MTSASRCALSTLLSGEWLEFRIQPDTPASSHSLTLSVSLSMPLSLCLSLSLSSLSLSLFVCVCRARPHFPSATAGRWLDERDEGRKQHSFQATKEKPCRPLPIGGPLSDQAKELSWFTSFDWDPMNVNRNLRIGECKYRIHIQKTTKTYQIFCRAPTPQGPVL